jgi:hypothetical protein
MDQLQTAWVHLARPFLSFGVHYAGPFYGKQRSLGSKIQVKCYVTIFICIAVLQRFHCTKGEMFIFVFWHWDNTCGGSSWTLRTQESFCIRSTSVQSSEICKFRNNDMVLYSSTFATLWGTLGGWNELYEISFKRNGRDHGLYFQRTRYSPDSSTGMSEFLSSNSLVQWSK